MLGRAEETLEEPMLGYLVVLVCPADRGRKHITIVGARLYILTGR
jgi:hypothetical protein